MTGRDELIEAIRARPDEDLPRLMYAEWLDEFGSGDLDRATAEFVRVSCDMRAGGRPGHRPKMPRAAYPWLARNWDRLLPGLCAAHAHARGPGSVPTVHARVGRVYTLKVRVREDRPAYAVRVGFLRGFVSEVAFGSRVSRDALEPLVRLDQPLAGVLLLVGQ